MYNIMFSVIGYSDDTRIQTINEGENSTLTVEIKKPAVGVGSLIVINFQTDSPNSGKCMVLFLHTHFRISVYASKVSHCGL